MTKKITKLNNDQVNQLSVYRDKWLSIGLSTEPLNFEKAKAAISLAYKLAGLRVPTRFEVADSPIDAVRVIQSIDSTQTSMNILNSTIYSCHDASWLGFYEYFRDVCDIKETNKLNGLIELAKHCGWVNVYDNLVVLQQRPTMILRDDQNRLHCDHGPAIMYRDGFSIYSWHGVRIPAEWIENKESLTPEIALNWENIEQRRCACEIIGWNKILEKLQSKVIDQDEDPMIGTLLQVNIPEVGEGMFLKVLCGTGREFALPVPPNMKTALEANAWTFGMDKAEDFWKPEVRT